MKLLVALSLSLAAPALAQAPDGAMLFATCKVCHSIAADGRNGVGPALNGVVGRKAGAVPGFKYSAAMLAYGEPWTPARLDAYLANPRAAVPGTSMIYPGLKDPAKRAALIAWIGAQ